VRTMSLPSGPKILVNVSTSNFSAAATSASAACFGEANFSAKEALVRAADVAFGAAFGSAAKATGSNRLAVAATMQASRDRFVCADAGVILVLLSFPSSNSPDLPTPSAASGTATTEASATTRAKAGRSTTTAAARIRSAVSPGAAAKGIAVLATAAGEIPAANALRTATKTGAAKAATAASVADAITSATAEAASAGATSGAIAETGSTGAIAGAGAPARPEARQVTALSAHLLTCTRLTPGK
jgi:hypothetical protein